VSAASNNLLKGSGPPRILCTPGFSMFWDARRQLHWSSCIPLKCLMLKSLYKIPFKKQRIFCIIYYKILFCQQRDSLHTELQ